MSVWIVGSSIVRDGFIEARKQPGGIHLSLRNRLGISIWWQGRGGLKLDNLRKHIRHLLTLDDTPDLIVIHIGGNDIGETRLGLLNRNLKKFMNWLAVKMPNCKIVWSAILPRLNWRSSLKLKSMDNCRRRLNSSVASHLISKGGFYIKYPDFKADHRFLKEDGVHLTKLGNQIFLNTIQGAIEQFVKSNSGGLTFPDMY